MDERLATFVVQSHHSSHPANSVDELERAAGGSGGAAAGPPGQSATTIDQGTLRLYIAYAKKHCHPKLQDADTEKMVQVRSQAPVAALPPVGADPCIGACRCTRSCGGRPA
jgi:DNA replication licensing factor MCM2